jgi:hypothetical protein
MIWKHIRGDTQERGHINVMNVTMLVPRKVIWTDTREGTIQERSEHVVYIASHRWGKP